MFDFLAHGVSPSLTMPERVQEQPFTNYIGDPNGNGFPQIKRAIDPTTARLRAEMDNYLKSDKLQLPGFLQSLSKGNATGASLNCGVRMVAGGGFEPPTFGL